MNATTKASRAVLAEYARKTLRPIEIIAASIFILALVGSAFLIANISGWWWLLMIIVIAYGLIGSLFWLILHFTIDKLRPEQTSSQKNVVSSFIAQLDKVSDTIGMTKFGLLLRIIGDVMRRREQNVLQEFAQDSGKLRSQFEDVIIAFK